MTSVRLRLWLGIVALLGSVGLAGAGPTLGPKDDEKLPATDLDRVRIGDPAPDFTLESEAGVPVGLSDFRGRANVVLVFYRGRW